MTKQAGRVYEGRHVVEADGANSFVARSPGLRRAKTTAAGIDVKGPATPKAMRSFGDAFCPAP